MSGRKKVADDAPWVSLAMQNPGLKLSLGPDLDVWDEDRIIEAEERNERGKPLSAEWFPEELAAWKEASRLRPVTLGDIFFAYGYWVVSEEAASVMRRFDPGNGALYPVTLYQKDRRTPVDHQYYCINFGNVKKALLPEQSQGLRPSRTVKGLYYPKGRVRNRDMAVSPAALEGPDIWIDPQLDMAFFVSGALGRALKAAGANRNFSLLKCRLVTGEEE